MESIDQFTCLNCNSRFSLDLPIWRCPCGGVLDVIKTISFDPSCLKNRHPSLWRYREVLPITSDRSIVSFGEGFTPMLRMELSNRTVWIKQDHLFPSGSYKDRGSTVLVSKIKELGIHQVVEDSSGNAGASIAAYCAKAGIECDIFVPSSTSPAKLIQIEAYGAQIHLVPGSRDDTAKAALGAAQTVYYASHTWNPLFFQGTKTFAYEICEQLNWHSPDAVVLPAGNGTLLIGSYIGFQELLMLQLIEHMPRMIAIQAQHCAPLYHAYQQKTKEVFPVNAKETLAEGIAITNPVRGRQMMEIVYKTNGQVLIVSENEIRASLKEWCKKGIYLEPTSACVLAGLNHYMQTTDAEHVVSVITGHGLKSNESIKKML